MKKEYKEVPVGDAKYIAEKNEKDEIIILSIDHAFNKVHLTTYGIDKKACKRAEITSEFLAEIFQLKDPQFFFDLIESIKKRYLKNKGKIPLEVGDVSECRQCSHPIQFDGLVWFHTNGSIKHAALPGTIL